MFDINVSWGLRIHKTKKLSVLGDANEIHREVSYTIPGNIPKSKKLSGITS